MIISNMPEERQPCKLDDSTNTWTNAKSGNDLSKHTNRYVCEGYGEFFGNGRETRTLGRRLSDSASRSNHTGCDFLSHVSACATDTSDYRSVQSSSYATLNAAHYKNAPRGRFRRTHRDPKDDPKTLSTSTTLQFGSSDVPYKTPMSLLAQSPSGSCSERRNPIQYAGSRWKYSYHGLPSCYPSVNDIDKRHPYPTWYVNGFCDGSTSHVQSTNRTKLS